MSFHVPNLNRVGRGEFASSPADGNNGLFFLTLNPAANKSIVAACIVSDGLGWEHVSVSLRRKARKGIWYPVTRCPTWEEMCKVKDHFWDDEDVVVQFHPSRSNYVNCHPYTLHLWRITDTNVRLPDPLLVGPPART